MLTSHISGSATAVAGAVPLTLPIAAGNFISVKLFFFYNFIKLQHI